MREDIYAFHTEGGEPFAVSMCGISYCDGSYMIHRPESKIFVMEYVVSGRGTVEEGSRSSVARAGDVYFLRKGRRHLYRSDEKEPWVKLWFNFTGETVERLADCYGIGSETVFHAPELRPLFEEAVALGRDSRDYRAVSEGIGVIFLRILQHLSHLGDGVNAAVGVAQRLRHYLDTTDDFSENLDAVTEKLGCTKSHAIREFRAKYGTTPYEYMQKRRFGIAKSLLRGSALGITEIADRLGFYDVHYFSGAFRKRFGISPAKYRRQ